jgi:hypothetical protein
MGKTKFENDEMHWLALTDFETKVELQIDVDYKEIDAGVLKDIKDFVFRQRIAVIVNAHPVVKLSEPTVYMLNN